MADEVDKLRHALRAQVEVSTIMMRRLGLGDQVVADATAQARAALAATERTAGRRRRARRPRLEAA